jgi:hypothetical protein
MLRWSLRRRGLPKLLSREKPGAYGERGRFLLPFLPCQTRHIKSGFLFSAKDKQQEKVAGHKEVNMVFAMLLIGFGLLMIFAPRLAFLVLRIVWLFLPEVLGVTCFASAFLYLHRQSPIAQTPGMFLFLVICTLILGAVVGRKIFVLYIFPYLPKGLFRGKDDGRN